jgi:hypothetical protein
MHQPEGSLHSRSPICISRRGRYTAGAPYASAGGVATQQLPYMHQSEGSLHSRSPICIGARGRYTAGAPYASE